MRQFAMHGVWGADAILGKMFASLLSGMQFLPIHPRIPAEQPAIVKLARESRGQLHNKSASSSPGAGRFIVPSTAKPEPLRVFDKQRSFQEKLCHEWTSHDRSCGFVASNNGTRLGRGWRSGTADWKR